MWEQSLNANWHIPYVGGLCEGYVEGAWGQATLPTPTHLTTSGVYANAVSAVNPGETAKWDNNPGNANHPGELPPAGLTVPIYFSLGSTKAGHTAIALSDGRIATSALPGYHAEGFIYPSLQAMIADYAKYNGGCTYLGWSEQVGNVRVVKRKENEMITIQQVDRVLKMGLRREPTAGELNNPAYQSDPGLLIDTVWNNGGAQSYAALSASTPVVASAPAPVETLSAADRAAMSTAAQSIVDTLKKTNA
jgi:hypothetical protein